MKMISNMLFFFNCSLSILQYMISYNFHYLSFQKICQIDYLSYEVFLPDLKSSPTINTLFLSANSITPGTKVFWGDPLM